jgi:hypothetical protein
MTERYDMPEYAQALWEGLYLEMQRVFWNRHQREYDYWAREDEFDIPGVTFRWYVWDDGLEADLSNFVCDAWPNIEIYFYKWPGRGMQSNVKADPIRWCLWYEACLAVIRAADVSDIGATT